MKISVNFNKFGVCVYIYIYIYIYIYTHTYIHQIFKMHIPFDLVILILGIYSKEIIKDATK